ncbi:MAG: DUF523 domain-containing protein [Patescibacteria group bacterium]|nr:DUF523 domain-containing protein [Patescibacteria group bacterium]MDD4304757.1 DUF523 domain-containing protein [Patescibacteria group bacterium]MDD4695768.1 DUF523 domain-containing protein [Patescibacteria group bacterium]
MKICSACLLGIKCRYDGKDNTNEKVLKLSKKEILIPICPEQLGGQSTPREDAEIYSGDGFDVLKNNAKVLESNGNDVTRNFVNGAEEVLKIAKLFNINEAILKQKSPSCGCGKIYDGTFSKNLIKGDGVTCALLKENGINVISEDDL